MSGSVDETLRAAFREEWGRVVAAVIARTGDWQLAEDCAQDAFTAAAARWPVDGVPTSPGGWLTTVARNRAIDRRRRAATEQGALRDLLPQAPADTAEPDEVTDERLRLIFACCHPALPMPARVALTLRTLCGLEIAEIAYAFGVEEAAMAKRLVRARQRIAHAGIPFQVPAGTVLTARLDGVLAVLYLLFTEGYSPTTGEQVVRVDLSDEAIRLTETLAELMPDQPDVRALLALELLHDARRGARTDADGRLVPLSEQDRGKWDRDQIARGRAELARALRGGADGRYALQARIALLHDGSNSADDVDWHSIARLYDRLVLEDASPQAQLARAVAVAAADGPERGLALIAELRAQGPPAGEHLLPATEAELLMRAGRRSEAADAYRRALALVRTAPEEARLRERLSEAEAAGPPSG